MSKIKQKQITIKVSERVLEALAELRDTGFYGEDTASVAEELLRAAVRKAMVERVGGAQ